MTHAEHLRAALLGLQQLSLNPTAADRLHSAATAPLPRHMVYGGDGVVVQRALALIVEFLSTHCPLCDKELGIRAARVLETVAHHLTPLSQPRIPLSKNERAQNMARLLAEANRISQSLLSLCDDVLSARKVLLDSTCPVRTELTDEDRAQIRALMSDEGLTPQQRQAAIMQIQSGPSTPSVMSPQHSNHGSGKHALSQMDVQSDILPENRVYLLQRVVTIHAPDGDISGRVPVRIVENSEIAPGSKLSYIYCPASVEMTLEYAMQLLGGGGDRSVLDEDIIVEGDTEVSRAINAALAAAVQRRREHVACSPQPKSPPERSAAALADIFTSELVLTSLQSVTRGLVRACADLNLFLQAHERNLSTASTDSLDVLSDGAFSVLQDATRVGVIGFRPTVGTAPEWLEVIDTLPPVPENADRIAVDIKYETELRPGCPHYLRGCSVVCPVCADVFPCRFCHDAVYEGDHAMPRNQVEEVVCNYCGMQQPISESCLNHDCPAQGRPFAAYYCPDCKFFDDFPGKDIYHCNKCRVCRIGPASEMEHCDSCGLCWHKTAHHSCNSAPTLTCPICFSDMRHSRGRVTQLPCGHYMHVSCWSTLLQTDKPICPTCRKLALAEGAKAHWEAAMDNWMRAQPTPEEFRREVVAGQCNECGLKFRAQKSFTCYKCPGCGSHNTHEN